MAYLAQFHTNELVLTLALEEEVLEEEVLLLLQH